MRRSEYWRIKIQRTENNVVLKYKNREYQTKSINNRDK